MKRALPSQVPTGLPSDQEQQLLQQQLQGLREERGPGGSLITTGSAMHNNEQPSEQQGQGGESRGYYRSESTASVNSYSANSLYSTSSTNTAFGSSLYGGVGGGTSATQRELSSASLSSLDCFNSIGSSLKRVKISTSPGELRLNKDIEAMAHNALGRNGGRSDGSEIHWISLDEPGGNHSTTSTNGGSASGGSSSMNGCNATSTYGNAGVHYHRALRSADGTIVVKRDIVDPLRLRISVTFRTNENPWQMVGWGVMRHNNTSNSGSSNHSADGVSNGPHASSSSCYETWNYLVQVPRMYPHSPPLIVRVTREGGTSAPSTIPELVQKQQQEQQQMQQQQQNQNAFQQYSSENTAERGSHPSMAAPVPLSARSRGPPMVERIIVSSNPSIHPPSAEEGEMTGICVDSDALAGDSDPLTSSLAIYGGWSPISRLSDLVTFLAELPVKRLAAWSAARGRSAGGLNAGAATSDGTGSSHSNQYQSQHQFQSDSYLQHEERRLGEDGSKRGVVRRHISSNHYAYNDYSDMDTGEPTIGDAGGRPSHLDRQRRRTSQESEVDVSAIHLAGSSHSGSEQDVTAGMGSRIPTKLEDPFHPNRFNQGFDRSGGNDGGNGTLSSLWRSASAPDVASQSLGMTPGLGQTAGLGAASTAASDGTGPIIPPGHSSFDARFRQNSAEDSMMDDDL